MSSSCPRCRTIKARRRKGLGSRRKRGERADELVLELVCGGPVDRVAVLHQDESEARADVAGESRGDVGRPGLAAHDASGARAGQPVAQRAGLAGDRERAVEEWPERRGAPEEEQEAGELAGGDAVEAREPRA